MVDFTFKSPEGKSYTVSGPPGATAAQAYQILQQRLGSKVPASGTSALRSLTSAAIRPIARAAIDVGSLVPDAAVEAANMVPGLGAKFEEPGTFWNRQLDRLLPPPESKTGRAAETASEFVLGSAMGGKPEIDFAAERAADLAKSAFTAARYVETRTGLRWAQLPTQLKQSLISIARNPKDLEKIDPREIERHAGQRTIAPQLDNQLRALTGVVAKGATPEGKKPPVLEGKTPLERGRVVQSTLTSRMKSVKGRVDKLFDQARASGEMESSANIQPLLDWLHVPENARYAGGWLKRELSPYVKFEEEAPGPNVRSLDTRVAAPRDPSTLTETQARQTKRMTVNDLERMRGEANKRAFSKDQMDREAFYARRAKDVIDQVLDKSGTIYKRARAGYAAYKNEWFRQRAIQRLTSNKRGTSDPAVAHEDVFQEAIVNGSAADVQKVRATLGATQKGKQAWAQLQAGAIDYLREGAKPRPGATSSIANRFLDRLHDLDRNGKLDVLFGPDVADQVRALAKTVSNVRGEEAALRDQEHAGRIIRTIQLALRGLPYVGYAAGHWPGYVMGHAAEYTAKRMMRGADRGSLKQMAGRAEERAAALRKLKRGARPAAGAIAATSGDSDQ